MSLTPEDKTKKHESNNGLRINYADLLNINIPPKQFAVLEITKNIYSDKIELLKKSDSVYLEMKNQKGKKVRFELTSIIKND